MLNTMQYIVSMKFVICRQNRILMVQRRLQLRCLWVEQSR